MDRIYRFQRHVYDLTRRYFLLGRDDLIGALDVAPGGTVLEIGCGTGRNLIVASRRYPEAHFYGPDISPVMLRSARSKIAAARLDGGIVLAEGDAADFDAQALFGRAHFDRVFFSYALSMIPRWKCALAKGYALASPSGGRVLVVDFGQQERLPNWLRAVLRHWLGRFHVEPRDNFDESVRDLAGVGSDFKFRRLFRDYAWRADLVLPERS